MKNVYSKMRPRGDTATYLHRGSIDWWVHRQGLRLLLVSRVWVPSFIMSGRAWGW